MPTSPSAKKRLRQNTSRAEKNRAQRSSMRTFEKRILSEIAAGHADAARALLPQVCQQLDKAAKKRLIHPNTAANHKSRIARKLASL